jgi:hypothetical protein
MVLDAQLQLNVQQIFWLDITSMTVLCRRKCYAYGIVLFHANGYAVSLAFIIIVIRTTGDFARAHACELLSFAVWRCFKKRITHGIDSVTYGNCPGVTRVFDIVNTVSHLTVVHLRHFNGKFFHFLPSVKNNNG